VWAAGEARGIGGVDVAILEGRIAGLAAARRLTEATRLLPERARARSFGDAVERAFALRPELRDLPAPDTIVCRCEDVTFEQIGRHGDWRTGKLHTRCGMGPCQGRVCGPALAFLLGWNVRSVRPPVFPSPVADLAQSMTMDGEESEEPVCVGPE
jgi:hypothetical protein